MAEITRESLAETHPNELQKVEEFLASSPDGRADPNNRGVNKAAIQLALAAVEQGHEPPEWLNPMFRRMLGYPPEIDRHTSLKGQRTLNQLTTILKGIPLERRESLLMQETYGVRVLCWSLAHLSGTLTPAIAERAAWKVADLGERENGGGTWTDPHLRDHQRMLFPHLGAVAVPPLVQEIDAGARRRHLLMDALGETRCPEAAEPLVQYVAFGAEKLQNLAKVGLNRLLEEGHLTAIYDAVEKQLKAKKKALRVAAAEVLVMLPNNEQTTTIVTHALNTAKDAEVRFRLQCWQGAQQNNPDEQFCRECQAAADPDKMAYVDSFLDTQNDNVTKYDVIPTMATWSQTDQIAGCVKLAVGDVEHYYTVTGLIEKEALKDSERSIRAIAWGTMDYIDHFRYDFQVTSLLECLESWNKEPTLDPILHVLHKSPGSRVTIYEYLTKRGFFLSNPKVLKALAQGLADSSKAVRKICKEALGKAGSAARPILEELQGQAPKAARKSMDELLASLPTEQSHTRIAHVDREALTAAHPPVPATHLEGTVPRFFPSSKYSVHLHHFRPEQTDVPSDAIVSIDHPSQEQLESTLAQPGLQSLNLHQANYYGKLPESAFGLLANCPSIRWLAASVYAYSDKDSPWLNNKSLAKLDGLDALEVLILRQHAGLTSLEHLPPLPSLRVLSTHGSTIKVDAKSLRSLKQQPQLVSLLLDAASEPSGSYYKNSRTNDKVLASLAELTNLKQLSLIHCEKLKGPGFEAFSEHPQLGWLDLTSCHKHPKCRNHGPHQQYPPPPHPRPRNTPWHRSSHARTPHQLPVPHSTPGRHPSPG